MSTETSPADRRETDTRGFVERLLASPFVSGLLSNRLALVGLSIIFTMVAIALVAGVLSGGVLIAVVVTVVFAGYRRGRNPDTLVGPLVTTTGDVFGMLFLLAAVRIVLGLGVGEHLRHGVAVVDCVAVLVAALEHLAVDVLEARVPTGE